ncbi:MAG: ribosomal protein S18-alanine N-acetyltransferase [Kofleriaceae bacterium]
MILARATEADLDAIQDIERHSFPRPLPRSSFETELTREWTRLVLARDQRDVVLGYINYWVVAGEVPIHSIATHPDRRRGGIGAILLAHALDEGRATGCHLATLEVRRGNQPALALYEGAGFVVIHVRARYYDDGEDALVMQRGLPGPEDESVAGSGAVRR